MTLLKLGIIPDTKMKKITRSWESYKILYARPNNKKEKKNNGRTVEIRS